MICFRTYGTTILCVKNVPHLTCYNLDIHNPIAIKFVAEMLLRKQQIRRCFVFPPHLSSASALSSKRGNPEDSALMLYACNTVQLLQHSTPFLLNHAPQKPQAKRINYKIPGVIRQREYESWVKKTEEIMQQLVEFRHAIIQRVKDAIFVFPVSAK